MTNKKPPKFRQYFPNGIVLALPNPPAPLQQGQPPPGPPFPLNTASRYQAPPSRPVRPPHNQQTQQRCFQVEADQVLGLQSTPQHHRVPEGVIPGSGWRQRSQAALHKRQNKRYADLARRHSDKTVHVDVPRAPTEFVKAATNNALMNDTLASAYPDHSPDTTPIYDRYELGEGTRLIMCYTGPSVRGFGPGHTRNLVCRFTAVIPAHSQQAILAAWRAMILTKPTIHVGCKETRSKTSAFHFGIWSTRMDKPVPTADTHDQPTRAQAATTHFIDTLRVHVAPHIFKLMVVYFKDQLQENIRVHRWPKYQKALENHPECNFGAAFFTVAAKEGSSESLHLDWNDHPRSVTWVVPIWDEIWEGGDLYVPQLNARVPSGSGDVVSFCSRHLAHSGTEITKGNRLVLTLFTDRTLMKRGLEATVNN